MHLGAASMLGATGANASKNRIPGNYDVLTYSNEDLKEVSSIGFTVHNIVVSDPTIFTEENIKEIKEKFHKNSLLIGNSRGR